VQIFALEARSFGMEIEKIFALIVPIISIG
jgi:hypothetical protein